MTVGEPGSWAGHAGSPRPLGPAVGNVVREVGVSRSGQRRFKTSFRREYPARPLPVRRPRRYRLSRAAPAAPLVTPLSRTGRLGPGLDPTFALVHAPAGAVHRRLLTVPGSVQPGLRDRDAHPYFQHASRPAGRADHPALPNQADRHMQLPTRHPTRVPAQDRESARGLQGDLALCAALFVTTAGSHVSAADTSSPPSSSTADGGFAPRVVHPGTGPTGYEVTFPRQAPNRRRHAEAGQSVRRSARSPSSQAPAPCWTRRQRLSDRPQMTDCNRA